MSDTWPSAPRSEGARKTISIEKYADYQDDKTPQTTYYEENRDLTVILNRGADKHLPRVDSDGIVVVRLNTDDAGGALVECEPKQSGEGHGCPATIEAALVHLEAARDRMRAFTAIGAAS